MIKDIVLVGIGSGIGGGDYTYNDITMTIMMRGERRRVGDGTSGMGTFTMKDWNDIIHELQQFWWHDDIKEDDMME